MSIVNNSQAKTQEENINFVAVRSFLGGNVDTLLENLAARRENDKNDSVDIFAAHTSPSINWKNVHTKTKLQILIEEKNALNSLPMSGDYYAYLQETCFGAYYFICLQYCESASLPLN